VAAAPAAGVSARSLPPASNRVVPKLRREDIREVIVSPCRVIYRRRHDALVALRNGAREFNGRELAQDRRRRCGGPSPEHGVLCPQMSNFGSIWKTIREVDILAIRREAEHDVIVACTGDQAALEHVRGLLLEGPDRYRQPFTALGLVGLDQVRERERLIGDAALLIVALDEGVTLSAAEVAGLDRLAALRPQQRILVAFGERSQDAAPWLTRLDQRQTTFVDPRAADAAERLAAAVLAALPAELHLAAARRLPGLRSVFARRLTAEVSFSNAAFALASGVPSLVPILGIPISAADTVVLTKNQALMVYRLALAYGAPPEFQRRMMEITPVIGAAVVWRQVAGGLVGLVPGYGILPKTAVAYAGTYITGRAAELWYATGLVSKADLRRFRAEATSRARAVTDEMTRQAREARGKAGRRARGASSGLRKTVDRVVPRRKPPTP